MPDPGIYAVPIDLDVVDMVSEAAPAAIVAEVERTPVPSESVHAVVYASQNLPLTS